MRLPKRFCMFQCGELASLSRIQCVAQNFNERFMTVDAARFIVRAFFDSTSVSSRLGAGFRRRLLQTRTHLLRKINQRPTYGLFLRSGDSRASTKGCECHKQAVEVGSISPSDRKSVV